MMALKVANIKLDNGTTMAELRAKVSQLAEQGVKLILLPALSGLSLYLSLPGHGQGSWTALLQQLKTELPGLNGAFLEYCTALARQCQIYLVPGTWLEPFEDGYLHRSCLLAPDGSVLGEQYQTHCSKAETAYPLFTSSQVQVIGTPFAKVGLVVGSDIFFPEVSRILTMLGAELLLAPAAVAAPYNPWRQLAAMWQEVQQNQVFGLENWLNLNLGSTEFAGQASILGPCPMTPGETGFFSRDQYPELAELDFHALQELRISQPILALLNKKLFARHFPDAYGEREQNKIEVDR